MQDDFGDDDEDDVEDDWKPPTAYMKKGQRGEPAQPFVRCMHITGPSVSLAGSVSAEAYGAFNQKKAFEPPVYEKSTEQVGCLGLGAD